MFNKTAGMCQGGNIPSYKQVFKITKLSTTEPST